jgi:ketosteroid isomerase-like protein
MENLLKPLAAEWENFSATPREFVAEGERVIALGTYSGTFRRTGRSFRAGFAHAWRVRGEKLASFEMHTDTAKVLEAVRAPE